MGDAYDFVVIGSGAGGSAVAARLAEGGARTLLVEKGVEAKVFPDAMEAMSRYYTNGGTLASTGNCLLPIPTGTVLGGTTKINSGTCMKPPEDLLRGWERSGSGSFRAEDFRPHLEAAWERLHVRPAPEQTMSPSTRLFFKGLDRLGIGGGHLLPRGESGCIGSGRCCFICPSNGKMSADKAFLDPLRGREGFDLAAGTELEGISAPRGRGEVRLWLREAAGGRRRTVSCKTLVLACGALRSPYFVRRFRLGETHALAGAGLSVHPASKVFACFDQPVRGWEGVPQGGGLVDPGEPRIRYEGVFTPPELAALVMPLEGRRLRWWLDRYDHVASFAWIIRDLSRGYVRYPLGPDFPVIRYRMGEEDLRLMLRAMRFAGKVFFAAGARRVALLLNREPNVFDSAEALDAADLARVRPAELQMMAFHPLGTCAMGRVVDDNLRLCDGVYVCDGSVVPESLGVNPQITIYAFALRLADHLLGAERAKRAES